VIGGAGYIGAHFSAYATALGYQCSVFDNLSTGHNALVPPDARFYQGDCQNLADLCQVMKDCQPDAVFHFAANSLVGESVQNPGKYYQNNILGTLQILKAMQLIAPEAVLVFSSTCAVYGKPMDLPIDEKTATVPLSPYGRSKLGCEHLIEDFSKAHGLRSGCLRYFNAAGAHENGLMGEWHEPETHLIPNIFKAVLSKQSLEVYGNDYPTKDGTCVRDYIHVHDLADAHLLAASYLLKQTAGYCEKINLGSGIGLSNLEIIHEVEKVTGLKVSKVFKPRRAGDPPALFANPDLALKVLDFKTRYSQIDHIIETAWQWHKRGNV
jgi:UDP-glucose 4-epimerase